jgi:hypothetical protein
VILDGYSVVLQDKPTHWLILGTYFECGLFGMDGGVSGGGWGIGVM